MVDKKKCEEYLEKFDSTVWSYSRVASFSCPYSWYETYVLGERGQNFHAYAGTSFHEVMEDFYNFILGGGQIDLIDHRLVLTEKLAAKLRKNPYNYQVPPAVRNGSYRKMMESLWYHVPFVGVTAVERYIEFDVAGYKFCGYLDLDAGEQHYDWKSRFSEDKYGKQQNLYLYGKEQIDGIKTRGFYIPQYKENMEVVHVPRNQTKINDAVRWIELTIPRIKEALEKADFPKNPNDSFFCTQLCASNTCEFRK